MKGHTTHAGWTILIMAVGLVMFAAALHVAAQGPVYLPVVAGPVPTPTPLADTVFHAPRGYLCFGIDGAGQRDSAGDQFWGCQTSNNHGWIVVKNDTVVLEAKSPAGGGRGTLTVEPDGYLYAYVGALNDTANKRGVARYLVPGWVR